MTSSPTTLAPHRFCIVNCYPAASRDNFDRSDVGHPHDMFKDFLRREAPNATTEIVYVADPDFSLPDGTTIEDFDGFIWTGSDLTVYHTEDPRVVMQVFFAGALMQSGAASWGSEWGIARNIELTDAGQLSPMLRGKPARFDGFIMHLDEVTRLPDGTPLLATNPHTHIQAAVIEDGDPGKRRNLPRRRGRCGLCSQDDGTCGEPGIPRTAGRARCRRRHHRPADPRSRATQLAAVHRFTDRGLIRHTEHYDAPLGRSPVASL